MSGDLDALNEELPADEVSLLPDAGGRLPKTTGKRPVVLIPAHVRESMWRHALSDISHEVGGVLIGRVNEGDPTVVMVEVAVPAHEARASSVHITFTADSWEHWHRLLDEEYAGRVIVGWYHSHPNHGIFLSGHDTFIHQNFFNEPWQVAVVIDPVRNEAGCFGWDSGEIAPLPQDHVAPRLQERPEPLAEPVSTARAGFEPSPTPSSARAWWLGWGVAIALFFIAVMQTASVARLSRVRDVREDVRILREEMRTLRSEVSVLRRQQVPAAAQLGNWVIWKDGDTFEKIAERAYGRAELGEVLRAINSPALGGARRPAVGAAIWVPVSEALLPPPRSAASAQPGP